MKNGLRRRAWLVALASVLLAVHGFADEVTLRNGDKLSGRVVSLDGDTLKIHSDVLDADVEIPWDQVMSFQTDGLVEVEMPDGRKVMGRVSMPAAADARIITSAGDEESLSRDGFKISTGESEEESPWSGNVRLDFATTQGNSNTATFGTSARVQRETDKTVLSAYFQSFFQRSDGERNAENYSWGARADYKFTERAYGYLSADWLSDSFRQLNLRTQLGLGGGYKFIDEENLDFAGELGLTYTDDDFQEPNWLERLADPTIKSADDEYVSARVAESLNWKINETVELRHFAEWLPNVEDPFNDYLMRAIIELRVALDQNLYLEVGAEDRYDNTPPKDIKRNDLRVFAALGYSW
ncbi:MAG: DUF481 domain-containing protein [Planctomycetota bacterium]